MKTVKEKENDDSINGDKIKAQKLRVKLRV